MKDTIEKLRILFVMLVGALEGFRRKAIFLYCDHEIEYTFSEDPDDTDEVYRKMLAHEKTCRKNPLVARISELEAQLDRTAPCANTSCPGHDATFEQNCGMETSQGEPAAVTCGIYKPGDGASC